MKQLITKSDGTPNKSKVYAVKYLQDKGISEDCLIQENGQFFYEDAESNIPFSEATSLKAEDISSPTKLSEKQWEPVTWETPVFVQGDERTKLVIPGTDVTATITAKHPAGQIRQVSSFEIAIGQENFVMSVDLISKIFRVKEVK